MTNTPPAATLALTDEHGHTQLWELREQISYQIGRDLKNDVALPFSWVSRRHAMIQVEEKGGHNLIDLGSANGTRVNGRRIFTPTRLKTGDRIMIGRTELSFSQTTEAQAPTLLDPLADDERTVAFVARETVTILICDIHGYTRLAETLGDRKISQLLQHWSGQVNKIVNEQGGTVDKFIGDAVMALWVGGEVSRAIRRALIAAVKISRFTAKLGEKVPNLAETLTIGAALNTGEAMLGNIGVDGQRDFTVVGDVVNIAFRLEEQTNQAEGIDCLIGAESTARLDGLAGVGRELEFSLKGRAGRTRALGCSFGELAEYLKAAR